jgi:hypothetical protein
MGSDQSSGRLSRRSTQRQSKFCSDPFCAVSGDYLFKRIDGNASRASHSQGPAPPGRRCAPGLLGLRPSICSTRTWGNLETRLSPQTSKFLIPSAPCFEPAALIGAHSHGTGFDARTEFVNVRRRFAQVPNLCFRGYDISQKHIEKLQTGLLD